MSHSSQFQMDASRKAGDLQHRGVLQRNIGTYLTKVGETKSHFLDWQFGREATRSVKWDAINHLDEYLEEFERNATARGTVVHWARDADEARAMVLEICRKRGVRKVVKSKSMVTEEIHLNRFLEAHGIQPIETDLGEYIVQLRGETPYHIVTPVMHLTRQDVDRTFHEKLGTPLGRSAEELALAARRELREEYLTADMGITGVNFLVAETGMISLTENEGNARLSTALPRIHVAISGIEKVVPNLEDLALFLPMLAVSGTGQQLTCYNTMIGGPRQPGEVDGPEEFHVILLDNGRTNLLADVESREALHCIRCGACLNACPVFKNVGGHSYGTTYQGPIGSVITPHLKGVEEWGHLSYASSLCGACTEVCPVKIDLHHHLLRNRRRAVKRGTPGVIERVIFLAWRFVMKSEVHYEAVFRVGRIFQKMARALGMEGTLLDPSRGWSRRRSTPSISDTSFRQWWRKREASKNGEGG